MDAVKKEMQGWACIKLNLHLQRKKGLKGVK